MICVVSGRYESRVFRKFLIPRTQSASYFLVNFLNITFDRKLVPSGTSDVRQLCYGRSFSPVILKIFKIVVTYKATIRMRNDKFCIIISDILFGIEHVQMDISKLISLPAVLYEAQRDQQQI
jgi:hypothetical protein